MSNVPIKPRHQEPQAPLVEDAAPTSGVRKLLDAFEERDLSRIRWSSVLAGLFVAFGVDTLLGLLGLAIGLSVIDLGKHDPLARLSAGLALWMAFSSLVALFVGSYAAAKLGGSIRRGDGALAGALTWAVALTLAVFVFGARIPSFASEVSVDDDATSTISAPAHVRPLVFIDVQDDAREAAQMGKRQLALAAWAGFTAAVVSLFAATAGGALGAVGKRRRHTQRARRTVMSKEDEQIPLY